MGLKLTKDFRDQRTDRHKMKSVFGYGMGIVLYNSKRHRHATLAGVVYANSLKSSRQVILKESGTAEIIPESPAVTATRPRGRIISGKCTYRPGGGFTAIDLRKTEFCPFIYFKKDVQNFRMQY